MSDFQIELYDETNEENYLIDIEMESFDQYIAATFDDPAEGGEIEFTAYIDGVEFEIPSHLESEADSIIYEKAEKMVKDEIEEAKAEAKLSAMGY